MYKKITVNDLVRVDPKDFDKDLDEVILKRLNERYSGKIIKNLGLVLLAANPRNYSKGRVLHGDPGIYYRLDFDLYIFKPELNEVVKGEIQIQQNLVLL
jgi:DNA-directed RNA polymerase subunit E'